MSGLFTTVMSCFFRTRVRGSVTPLMYGREANDLRDSDASTILKNVPTSSSGDNTVERRVFLAWMFLMKFDGESLITFFVSCLSCDSPASKM